MKKQLHSTLVYRFNNMQNCTLISNKYQIKQIELYFFKQESIKYDFFYMAVYEKEVNSTLIYRFNNMQTCTLISYDIVPIR